MGLNNHAGNFLAATSATIPYKTIPLVAESMSFLAGPELAQRLQLQRIIIEGDSLMY